VAWASRLCDSTVATNMNIRNEQAGRLCHYFSAGVVETKTASFCRSRQAAFDAVDFFSARMLIPVNAQHGCDFAFCGGR